MSSDAFRLAGSFEDSSMSVERCFGRTEGSYGVQ